VVKSGVSTFLSLGYGKKDGRKDVEFHAILGMTV
jgi:hypothetical protein